MEAGRENRLFAVVAVAYVLIALALAPGTWILDDHVNFANLVHWLNGDVSWQAAVLDVQAGGLGRPLSHLSFLATAVIVGYSPVAFKLINVALHIGCGVLLFLLLRDLVKQILPRAHAKALAGTVAGLWLLLPLHISTVLYPVQRMTLLSALFTLGAMLAYLRGRQRLDGDPRSARQSLFLVFPLLCLMSLLSKETGALTPLYALLIEVCYFGRGGKPERRTVAVFFSMFLVLPLLAGLSLFALDTGRWLDYSGREFDLAGRLATQPVILLEYLRAVLLPLPQWLHLYREGYPTMPQWTGLAATTFWLAWVSVGLALIRRVPVVAFGMLLFVAGHLIESTVVPLELYFEHRNYLPSVGIVMVLVWLALRVAERVPVANLGLVVLAGFTLAYAVGSAHRAWQWRDIDRLLATEGPALPEISRRLQIDRAIRAFETGNQENLDHALSVLATGNAGDRAAAAQWRAVFACDKARLETGYRQVLAAAAPPVVTHNHASYMNLLVRRVERGTCEGLNAGSMLVVLDAWRASAQQPSSTHGPRQLAIQQARMHLLNDDPAAALAVLPEPGRRDFDAQVLRIRVLVALDRKAEARDLLRRLQAADRGWYRSRTQALAQLEAAAR